MTIKKETNAYSVFAYEGENVLLVAVPDNYIPYIEQAEEEYGQIENIPSAKQVRGIYVTKNLAFNEWDPKNDFTVNRLRLYYEPGLRVVR